MRGDPSGAVARYAGPFLDGFYVTEASEFERWVDAERARLLKRACGALETLATEAAGRGDHPAAAERWRQLAALDPASSHAALSLMNALVAAGERAKALEVGQEYADYMRRQLDAAPARAVAELIEVLRQGSGERRLATPRPGPAPHAAAVPAAVLPLQRRFRWSAIAAVIAVAVVGAIVVGPTFGGWLHKGTPIIAVGVIRDYTGSDSAPVAPTVAEMLATNLARVPRLTVLSTARMYEVLGGLSGSGNEGAAWTRAARQARATQLLQGALYRRPDGRLRLELQRIDLRSGVVQQAYAVEGSDPFVVTDSATARIAAGMGVRTDTLRVADVTTKSLAAYRLYQEGLRARYTDPDVGHARRLFAAAEAEDSGFVMAAYYSALSERLLGMETAAAHFERAARLADRAPDRVRLLVRASWALEVGDPARYALAETLSVRYPSEPDGRYLLGASLLWSGDFLDAVRQLRLVVAMDSQSLRGSGPVCRACQALGDIVFAYMLADSFPAAERTAREWLRVQPQSSGAWNGLATIFEFRGASGAALTAYHQAAMIAPLFVEEALNRSRVALRRGDFAEAAALLNDRLRHGTSDVRGAALWLRAIALRNQGRLREAQTTARQIRDAGAAGREPATSPPFEALTEAIVLFEAGRAREAAALFDSLAHYPPALTSHLAPLSARNRCWMFTHEATALAAAGDTGKLSGLADSVELLGPQSAYGRDRLLHHHIRGLLLAARGRPAEAAAQFRRAVFSFTGGYTRTNLELARALMQLRRRREAVAVLQPAFRGPLDASNLYVTHTELHEMLARAFEAAGELDSAAVHYGWVVRAWSSADPEFRSRLGFARQRLAALAPGRLVRSDR